MTTRPISTSTSITTTIRTIRMTKSSSTKARADADMKAVTAISTSS